MRNDWCWPCCAGRSMKDRAFVRRWQRDTRYFCGNQTVRRGETRMDAGYRGGMLRRQVADHFADNADWRCPSGDNELSLDVQGGCARLFTWDSLAILIR